MDDLPPSESQSVHARWALVDGDWLQDVRIDVAHGRIVEVTADCPEIDAFDLVLPGFHNVHAQSFLWLQRGQHQWSDDGDSQSELPWRELVLNLARSATLGELERAATHAYRDMVNSGFVSVGEFLWIHQPLEDDDSSEPWSIARAYIEAAKRAGLHLVLLPVYVGRSGFGRELAPEDARFSLGAIDDFLHAVDALASTLAEPGVSFGLGAHGIDTVHEDELRVLAEAATERGWILHVPASSTAGDVERCQQATGRSPVDFLHALGVLGPHVTLLHGVHIGDHEFSLLAESETSLCACPTMDRELGAGLRHTRTVLRKGVRLGLGTGHCSVLDPRLEMMLLETHERLRLQRRIVLTHPEAGVDRPSQTLLKCATEHSARALGLPSGAIAPGKRADLVALQIADHVETPTDAWEAIDTWLYSAVDIHVDEVWVGGHRQGIHT